MRAQDGPAPDRDRRGADAIRRELVQEQTDAGDVGDRVVGADLVEVDLADRPAVRPGLGVGERLIDRAGVREHRRGQGEGADDREDVGEAAMAVMARSLRSVTFFYAVEGDGHMGPEDALVLGRDGPDPDAGQGQVVHRREEALRVGRKLVERGHQHVARRAAGEVEIEYAHARASPTWLIMLARQPAPKPLSMLTTLTPLAHELSIESRAASPPNDAP